MRDIDDIRRDNLKLIEAEAGGPTAAAGLLDMSVAQFSNLRDGAKDSKTGKPRGMRKETARKIEEAAGKHVGWLDVDHSSSSLNTGFAPVIGGKVPVISWAQAAEFTDGIVWETNEYVNTWAPVQRYTFALHVLDDRMEPAIPQGSIIVVEPQLGAAPNDYVIVRDAGAEHAEATCKQLVRDGNDLYLKPRNERYPIKPLGDAQIVGVVREVIQKFK